MAYYVIFRRKGAKKWLAAIPAKKGVSLTKLRSVMKTHTKPGYEHKIISSTQLKQLIIKQNKLATRKTKTKRVTKKRRIVRHKRKK